MTRSALRPMLFALVAVAAVAPALAEPPDEDWHQVVERVVAGNAVRATNAADPLAVPMTVCQDTACARPSEVALEPAEVRALRGVFHGGARSAEHERAMIARAVALAETFAGSRNGSWADHPRNLHEEGEEGQLDCVSEAANTRTYLDRLDRAGLLRFHEPGGFVLRYVVVLPHMAVLMRDAESGEEWVVDSWEGANGEEPLIEPWLDWRLSWKV